MTRNTRSDTPSPDPAVITDPAQRIAIESANGLRQFDAAMAIVESAVKSGGFRLRQSTICELNRIATERLNEDAGLPRRINVYIEKSAHRTPDWKDVPRLLDELCEYVNDHWATATAIHLAAYLMWRINWVHPFIDGNGRAARMVSYLALCIKLGFKLPGELTIPDQIASDKHSYYAALEKADQAYTADKIDVSAMENLLEECLATQLLNVHDHASGKTS